MAVVKIKQIHSTLKAAIEYIVDPTKTNGGIMTSSNCGIPSIAASVHRGFERTMEDAENNRTVGKPGSVLAHHVIQSFKPGEITPNQAHDLGVEFIEKILGGNDEYDYVIATHVDRDHIHNHIMFNPINRKTLRRIRTPQRFLFQIRELSDELCRKQGLSIVEHPTDTAIDIGEIYARAHGRSAKAKLEAVIDEAVRNTFSWESFTESMKEMGVHVSFKGENILFHAPDILTHKVRGKKLGIAYTEAAIMSRLGRQNLVEFVVQPFMVKAMHTEQYRVRLPSSRPPAYITVDSHHLNNHGTHWRMYLPETMQTWTTDVYGRIQKELTTHDLGDYFSRPDPLTQALDRPQNHAHKRGKTAAQQRFYAVIDRKVAELREQGAWINLLAQYNNAPDPQAFLEELVLKADHLTDQINTALVERQHAQDADRDVRIVDARIDELAREISTLKAFIKEQTSTTLKGQKR